MGRHPAREAAAARRPTPQGRSPSTTGFARPSPPTSRTTEFVREVITSVGADKVFRLSQGSKAMRDSAMIYLSYAKYVAYGMPESEDMVQDELQG